MAAKLAFLAVIVAFFVIALGAFTRLADAGLGCPDWPTCYGHILWPTSEAQIEVANSNSAYNVTPVETDKAWPEQLHRIFASSLGLFSLILFGLAFKHCADRRQKLLMSGVVVMLLTALISKIALKMSWSYGAEAMHDVYDLVVGFTVLGLFVVILAAARQHGPTDSALKLTTFLVGFVILQGLFGMWTVTLKVWPQVVTLHLLGGFSVVSIMWILVQRLQNLHWALPASQYRQVKALKPFAIAGLVVVFLQIALGGWTTSNYAAVACPDLPTCQAQWWPQMDFIRGFDIFQEIGPNYLGGQMENEARIAIHMAHRIGAIITSVYLIFLFLKLLAVSSTPTTRIGVILMLVLLAQVVLGLSNIIFHFPLTIAVLHNGVGAVLLLVLVTITHRVLTVQTSSGEALENSALAGD
jgi:cytochrome c oxidase assembly protein subunit 15